MGLENRRALLRIVEGVMGIGTIFLVFDEPIGRVELADVVIQRARSNQIDICIDGTSPFFCEAADHQGVFEGARSFTGQAPQQRTLLVRQFQ